MSFSWYSWKKEKKRKKKKKKRDENSDLKWVIMFKLSCSKESKPLEKDSAESNVMWISVLCVCYATLCDSFRKLIWDANQWRLTTFSHIWGSLVYTVSFQNIPILFTFLFVSAILSELAFILQQSMMKCFFNYSLYFRGNYENDDIITIILLT